MTNVTIKQVNEAGETVESEVGLADIAGIDMNAVEAFEGGFEPPPKGVFVFDVKDAGLEQLETKNGMSAVIYFDTEIAAVHALVDDSIAPETLIGWKHRETIFVSDLAKSVGQAKALMQNAGFQGSGTLEHMLDAFCGSQFIAPVKHRKDKNDTDRVYGNIVVGKVTPVNEPEEATQTEAKPGLV